MRILYLDIDTLRADHLGCYGYHRHTSPNIDRLAARGVRFENCYVSDAPCLPSRASLFTGRFGIHNGAVGHGGTCGDLRLIGYDRRFRTTDGPSGRPGLVEMLRRQGVYPVSFSPFAERHSAWWFYEGWREMYNTGRCGGESAEEIVPQALEWIDRHAAGDDWMLHVNIWDPHTPYRAPEDFGNPFAGEPLAGWYTEEMRARQWDSFGPGTPQEPGGDMGGNAERPRAPRQIASMEDYRRWVDGYDCGIAYADMWVGRILDALAAKGVLDETIVVITSDHGENLGELGVIGDHATADHITSRVPMIVHHPRLPGGRVDEALHYQCDVGATLLELLGGEAHPSWDARGFADAMRDGSSAGREFLVVSQNAWSCMRSVRWGDWMFLRTYHTGLKDLRPRMLFNVAQDPHMLHDLAAERPDVADRCHALLEEWTAEMLTRSDSPVDPLWTVMSEGGPFHTRSRYDHYLQRLRETGRAQHAEFLRQHPTGILPGC